MSPTQTPAGDEALALLTTLMQANHQHAAITQRRLFEDLSRLTGLVLQLRDAELFRDEAVRFASADAIAAARRANLRLVTGDVTTLPAHVTTLPAGPFGGNAA